jgi:hypothetical protein
VTGTGRGILNLRRSEVEDEEGEIGLVFAVAEPIERAVAVAVAVAYATAGAGAFAEAGRDVDQEGPW